MGLWWGKCFDHWLVCDSVHCGGLCSIPLRDDAGTGMGQRGDLPRRIPLRTDLEHAQPRHRKTQTAITAQGSQTTGDDVISKKNHLTITWRSCDNNISPQCVAITGCGNFCVLGMSTGHVEMFNIQSGIHRGEFGKPQGHHFSIFSLVHLFSCNCAKWYIYTRGSNPGFGVFKKIFVETKKRDVSLVF